MSSLRVHYLTLILFTFVVSGGTFFFAYQTYEELTSYKLERNRSLDVLNLAYGVIQTPKEEPGHRLDLLRSLIPEVNPEKRRETLVSLMESLERRHSSNEILRKAKVALKNEIDVQKFWKEKIEVGESKAKYFLSLAVFLLISGFLVLCIFIEARVLRPIQALYRKMFEFINNKYSYQFKVPSSDELGQLEGTFNSLAQKVLANIEELKALDQAKSDFLSIASHELRTPMTSIKGSLSLLQFQADFANNDQTRHLLAIAEKETDRLIRLINELLDLAKVEARQFTLKKEWIDLKDILNLSAAGIEGLSKSAGVSVKVESPGGIKVHVDGDRIQQVITNLLSNAIKFSPKGSTVTLQSEVSHERSLYVLVKDMGPGIAPSDQALIFDKFRQATSPQNPLVKGTGLGLAIVKALVEEHGGRVGVRSAIGEGSTFYFSLTSFKYDLEQKNQESQRGVAA